MGDGEDDEDGLTRGERGADCGAAAYSERAPHSVDVESDRLR